MCVIICYHNLSHYLIIGSKNEIINFDHLGTENNNVCDCQFSNNEIINFFICEWKITV